MIALAAGLFMVFVVSSNINRPFARSMAKRKPDAAHDLSLVEKFNRLHALPVVLAAKGINMIPDELFYPVAEGFAMAKGLPPGTATVLGGLVKKYTHHVAKRKPYRLRGDYEAAARNVVQSYTGRDARGFQRRQTPVASETAVPVYDDPRRYRFRGDTASMRSGPHYDDSMYEYDPSVMRWVDLDAGMSPEPSISWPSERMSDAEWETATHWSEPYSLMRGLGGSDVVYPRHRVPSMHLGSSRASAGTRDFSYRSVRGTKRKKIARKARKRKPKRRAAPEPESDEDEDEDPFAAVMEPFNPGR